MKTFMEVPGYYDTCIYMYIYIYIYIYWIVLRHDYENNGMQRLKQGNAKTWQLELHIIATKMACAMQQHT